MSVNKKRLVEIYADQLAGKLGDDETTLPKSMPIMAIDQTSTQLSTEAPPIEDPDYEPETSKELSIAAREIALKVPDDQIGMFYSDLLSLLETAQENHNNPKFNKKVREYSKTKTPINVKKESKNSKKVLQKCVNYPSKRYITNVNNHKGELMGESNKTLVSNRRGGMRAKDYGRKWTQEDKLELSYNDKLADLDDDLIEDELEYHPDKADIKAFMEEEGIDDASQVYGSKEYSLKDILTTNIYPSVKGPAGLSNKIGRNIFPVLRMAKNAPQLLDRLLLLFENEWSLEAYLDAMYYAEYYNEEEIDELRKHPEATRELESYRYVVQQIIVVPAVKQLKKLEKMGKDVFDPMLQKSQISPSDAELLINKIKSQWDLKPAARKQVAADRGIESMTHFDNRNKSTMG
jgi:hypothetical protein